MRLEDIKYDIFNRVKELLPASEVKVVWNDTDNEINAIEIHTPYKVISLDSIKLFCDKYQEASKGKIKAFIEANDDRLVIILTYS